MEQSGTSTRLAGAVQGLTSELVSALQSGDPFGSQAASRTGADPRRPPTWTLPPYGW